jgi:serine/threonine protein kinase
MEIAPGTLINDQFQIIELLGHGGMGSVYLAMQRSLQRTIALKILRQNSSWGESRSFEQRFFKEASICASLSHRNIIKVFDFGFSRREGVYFIALEYLEGETLGQRLARVGPIPEEELIPLAIEVVLGLRYLHKKGVIHRDLKPENLMLSSDPEEGGFVKLLDFGLAKEVNKSSSLTTAGTYMGSPSYMSPEQADNGSPDERSDIYSLGVVLYQSICGRVPFRESSSLKTMMAHLSQRPPAFPAEHKPSPLFERFIFRMLEKDPDARPQSAAEVLTSLRDLQAQFKEANKKTAAIKLPLAAQPPSIWVLSQDPSMKSNEVVGALALLQDELSVSFIATEDAPDFANRLESGALLPPWIVIFGDMQVLIEDALLRSLSGFGCLAKILVSTHYNTEMLQHCVNFCGLDYHIALPSSQQDIIAAVHQMIGRVRLVRLRYGGA